MQVFKNKIFVRILSVIMLCAFVFLMDRGLGFLLEPVSFATYFNHDMELIEKEAPASVVLFAGASRTHRTFAPQILEDKWGVDCVIIGASSGQNTCGTYYIVKDMIERVHPQKVYIGVTIDQLVMKTTELQRKMIVYDRLSLKNRILMAINGLSLKEKIYLFETYRFRDQFGLKSIRENLEKRKELEETDYDSWSPTRDHYSDTGFLYSYVSTPTGMVPIKGHADFSEDLIVDENLYYLDKCIDMCKENNIEVNLVTGITSVMRMYYNEDYQAVVDFYTKYAAEKGIRYYNLNYLKGREQIIPDESMFNYNHLNGEGGYTVSRIFADIVSKDEAGEDISGYFYKNMDEFRKDVKRVVSVKGDIKKDKDNPGLLHVHMQSLQNDDVEPIYRVLIKYSEDDDFRVVSDWSKDTDTDIEPVTDKGYVIAVEAAAGNYESYGKARQEYKY